MEKIRVSMCDCGIQKWISLTLSIHSVNCIIIIYCVKVKVLVAKLCLTHWDHMDCSLTGSSCPYMVKPGLSWHKSDAAAAGAKSLQSCPTLCDPMDGSPPGSPVPEILQARTMVWVAISFSNAWKWKWRWSCSVVSDSSRPHRLQSTRLLHP